MERFDLVVIGGGPAGYSGAIRAAQLGMRVACVESFGVLGGTCLNVGCIPSKALLQSSELYHQASHDWKDMGILTDGLRFDFATMQSRKSHIVSQMNKGIEGLFKKNKISYFVGLGKIVQAGKVQVALKAALDGKSELTLETSRIMIATGSVPIELPFAKFDEQRILSSTGALALAKVPEHLVVIGGGVIGLELGSVYARLGAKITVIEALSSILAGTDDDISRVVVKALNKLNFTFHTDTKFAAAKVHDRGVTVTIEPKGGEKQNLEADHVLVCVGRKPRIEGLGAKEVGIGLDERGRIKVDNHYETSVKSIYAVGDVIAGPMLAHKAEEEGIACVENMAGVKGHVNYEAIPGVVYTWPEIASTGLSEKECRDLGRAVKVGKFPYAANGRAKANGFSEGFVKVIADKNTDRILGVHIVGPHASELIAEAVLGLEYKASAEDIARTVHAHPTLSEAFKEACLAVDGRAINF